MDSNTTTQCTTIGKYLGKAFARTVSNSTRHF